MATNNSEPVIPLKEFDAEMATTRKMLERLPKDQDQFKPHEKSMEFGRLSRLVATIPSWIAETLQKDMMDISAGPKYFDMKQSDIMNHFDSKVQAARAALQQVNGDALDATWTLRAGEQVLETMSRGEGVRQHLSHLIHHRGQLSVYERLVNVKVPQIYGPSADEPEPKK